MRGFLEHLEEADKSTDNKKVPSPNDKGSWRKPVQHGAMSRARQLARMAMQKQAQKKMSEEVQLSEEKHRVQVTVSNPHDQAVTQRGVTHQKFIRISQDKVKDHKDAVEHAKKHYKKMGWKVHDAEHVGMVREDTEINNIGESNDN